MLRNILAIVICLQSSQLMGSVTDSATAASVLVGAVSGSSVGTFGTGFIVEHRGRLFVITCRHVIAEADSSSLFAISRPRKTFVINPLQLGAPVYHPSDSSDGTYDVAALEVKEASLKDLGALGVVPLHFRSATATLDTGSTVIETGYPIAYAQRELARGTQDRLPPLFQSGVLSSLPLDALTRKGFTAPLRDVYFAETAESALGNGASGGLVFSVGEDRSIEVVGVLLGAVDAKLVDKGRSRAVHGFVFTSANRIVETLR